MLMARKRDPQDRAHGAPDVSPRARPLRRRPDLEVNGDRHRAAKVVIDVGARPAIPPIPAVRVFQRGDPREQSRIPPPVFLASVGCRGSGAAALMRSMWRWRALAPGTANRRAHDMEPEPAGRRPRGSLCPRRERKPERRAAIEAEMSRSMGAGEAARLSPKRQRFSGQGRSGEGQGWSRAAPVARGREL